MPDVGEGAGQVDDKSPTEEWRACKCCHGLMLFAFYLLAIEGLGMQSDMRIVLRLVECGCAGELYLGFVSKAVCLLSFGCLARLFEVKILGFGGQLSLAPCWFSEWLRLLEGSEQLMSNHNWQMVGRNRIACCVMSVSLVSEAQRVNEGRSCSLVAKL